METNDPRIDNFTKDLCGLFGTSTDNAAFHEAVKRKLFKYGLSVWKPDAATLQEQNSKTFLPKAMSIMNHAIMHADGTRATIHLTRAKQVLEFLKSLDGRFTPQSGDAESPNVTSASALDEERPLTWYVLKFLAAQDFSVEAVDAAFREVLSAAHRQPSDAALDAAVAFLDDAARYFEHRDTAGEDKAHWANVFNAENCRKISATLSAHRARSRQSPVIYGIIEYGGRLDHETCNTLVTDLSHEPITADVLAKCDAEYPECAPHLAVEIRIAAPSEASAQQEAAPDDCRGHNYSKDCFCYHCSREHKAAPVMEPEYMAAKDFAWFLAGMMHDYLLKGKNDGQGVIAAGKYIERRDAALKAQVNEQTLERVARQLEDYGTKSAVNFAEIIRNSETLRAQWEGGRC